MKMQECVEFSAVTAVLVLMTNIQSENMPLNYYKTHAGYLEKSSIRGGWGNSPLNYKLDFKVALYENDKQ